MSTDVVDSARFLCVAAVGAPSTLALLAAASPLLPPAPAASVLPALGSCCSASAPAAGSTPRVFDLSLRPPPDGADAGGFRALAGLGRSGTRYPVLIPTFASVIHLRCEEF